MNPTPKMDPLRRAQIILLCDICKTAHLQSHCERCDISLCEVCVGKHLSNTSIRHKVVPYKYRNLLNYSKCSDHVDEHCKHYCEKCDIPVCSICVSSSKHEGHDISDILKKLYSKTESLQKDLEELETEIYPRYEEMTFDVQTEKSELESNYGKLTSAADQQGEILHREITAIVNQRKSDIQELKNKHLSALNKNAEEIKHKSMYLKQIIADLKSILRSNDVSLTSTYKSRNSEFRTLPPHVQVTSPSFSPQKINKDQLNELFGSLSPLSMNTEYSEAMKSANVTSSPPDITLLDEPRLTVTISTEYGALYSVMCLNEKQIWTCGDEDIIKLLDHQGNLLTSIEIKSGNDSEDIAVTRDGYLVYIDTDIKTVNLVINKQIRTVISQEAWSPLNVCSTASDDLLVTMINDDETQAKVARYSGSTETQLIQFDDRGYPLYSSSYCYKYISENRNLDICVADRAAKTVVVVNQSGKLRFRYSGHPSNVKEAFDPVGITTDSQSHILTAANDRIHILNQDGQFLRYIHNLRTPHGLCVDTRDNLFVAEYGTGKVKKIQYLSTQC